MKTRIRILMLIVPLTLFVALFSGWALHIDAAPAASDTNTPANNVISAKRLKECVQNENGEWELVWESIDPAGISTSAQTKREPVHDLPISVSEAAVYATAPPMNTVTSSTELPVTEDVTVIDDLSDTDEPDDNLWIPEDHDGWSEPVNFLITHYCPCIECCGKTDGITATGVLAKAGRTIAVDPNVIPYGSEVLINGHVYIAEDCGGSIKQNRIDIFCDDHEEALSRGKFTTSVQWRAPL